MPVKGEQGTTTMQQQISQHILTADIWPALNLTSNFLYCCSAANYHISSLELAALQ